MAHQRRTTKTKDDKTVVAQSHKGMVKFREWQKMVMMIPRGAPMA